MSFLRRRTMGTLEASDRLLHHHMFECDVKIPFISTDAPENRWRQLKTFKKGELEEFRKENADVSDVGLYATNTIDDYYPKRPKQLAKMSLYQYLTNFE